MLQVLHCCHRCKSCPVAYAAVVSLIVTGSLSNGQSNLTQGGTRSCTLKVENSEVVTSGLGDRLGVLLNLAALGHMLHCKVIFGWVAQEAPLDAKRRVERPPELFNWTYMSSLISLPSSVEVMPEPALQNLYGRSVRISSSGHGMQQVPQCAFMDWVDQDLLSPEDLPAYMRAYEQVGRSLQIGSQLPAPPDGPYIALHVRRHRIWNVASIESAQAEDEYTDLLLTKAFDELLARSPPLGLPSTVPVMVISDTPLALQRWRAFVRRRGLRVLLNPIRKLPVMWRAVIDLFLIAGSVGVITNLPFRGGWSSFSAVPAMVRRLPNLIVNVPAFSWEGSRYAAYASRAGLERMPDVYFFGHPDYAHAQEVVQYSLHLSSSARRQTWPSNFTWV